MVLVIRARNSGRKIAAAEDERVIHLENCWYYEPQTVDQSQLTVTDRTYTCPYKGVCHWVDLDAPNAKGRNVGFIYGDPLPGYENIKGRFGFYARDTSTTLAAIEEQESTQ